MPDPTSARTVRRATLDDVAAVAAVLHAAAGHLTRQGWHNWDPPYPAERVATDVAEREVYLMVADDGAAAGTFTLGVTAPRPFDPEPWAEPGAAALYLNRLAVHPAREGTGVGGRCLREIARLARARGVRAVRCEVMAANARLCGLYERHGYEARGERSHSGWTFAAYEWIVRA